MNTPAHFKEQLADELRAHAAARPHHTGHRALLPTRAPRRRIVLTIGIATAAAAMAIAVPLATGTHNAQDVDSAMPRTSNSSSASPAPQGGPGTPLNIVNADYAVRSKADGMVSIQLFDVKGAAGLQAVLDQAKIPAKVIVPSASCRTSGHVDESTHGSLLKAVPLSGHHGDGSRDIKPSAIEPGDHLLFIPDTSSGKPHVIAIRLVHQVPSCIPAA
ncbi:hypothetical protein [Streptomyces griseofuscus]|uniref:hypothetical protein n=1 Tax=Streptomyces griseofuscus TaxID=146922 RepID=UPI0034528C43